MDTQTFTFHDLIALLIPGGTFLFATTWLMHQSHPVLLSLMSSPAVLAMVAIIFASYFTGHIINQFGRWLNGRLGLRRELVYLLTTNGDLAHSVDAASKQINARSIYLTDVVEQERTFDLMAVDAIFNAAYVRLGQRSMLVTASVLMGQFSFFRNAMAMAVLLMAPWAYALLRCELPSRNAIAFLIILLVLGPTSYWFMRLREGQMIKTVFTTFISLDTTAT